MPQMKKTSCLTYKKAAVASCATAAERFELDSDEELVRVSTWIRPAAAAASFAAPPRSKFFGIQRRRLHSLALSSPGLGPTVNTRTSS